MCGKTPKDNKTNIPKHKKKHWNYEKVPMLLYIVRFLVLRLRSHIDGEVVVVYLVFNPHFLVEEAGDVHVQELGCAVGF